MILDRLRIFERLHLNELGLLDIEEQSDGPAPSLAGGCTIRTMDANLECDVGDGDD